MNEVRLQPGPLKSAIAAIFAAHECDAREANAIADHLVEADLAGHPSHGAGLVPIYLHNLLAGKVRRGRTLERVPLAGNFHLFDGGFGFGQSLGIALVHEVTRLSAGGEAVSFGLRNAHHLGRIGDYGERLAEQGLVTILLVNTVSRPIVAPFGGTQARLGTNPICIAMPREAAPPLVLDFATSAIAVGKCRVAKETGTPLPPDVAIDALGQPTTEPAVLYEQPQGALLPMAGHKGGGLNLLCELLACCIGGLTMLDFEPGSSAAINSLVGFSFHRDMVPAGAERIEALLSYFLAPAATSAAQDILLPGDLERRHRLENISKGVMLPCATWEEIKKIANQAGVAHDVMEALGSEGAR